LRNCEAINTNIPAISSDGRYVALGIDSSLDSQDTNTYSDIFQLDRQTGELIRVSTSNNGDESNLGLDAYAFIDISEDGCCVAFSSNATNLVDNDTNNATDIFVRDRLLRTTKRVSVDSSGNQANGRSYYHSISADGRYVAFTSEAPNLSGDNGVFVFVHDLQTGITTEISRGFAPSIDKDGRFVTFSSVYVLTDGDTPNQNDVFLYDLTNGSLKIISSGVGGVFSEISDDGQAVAFSKNFTDVLVYDANTNLATSIGERFGQSFPLNRLSSEVNANGDEKKYTYDRLGNVLSITDPENNKTSYEFPSNQQLIINQITRVSVDSNGNQGNGDSYESSISADGRYVTYFSTSSNLVDEDTNNTGDIFLYDRQTQQTTRVSLDSNGVEGNSFSYLTTISADGRYIAFSSYASNLVSDDTNGTADIFIRDLQTEQTTRVSIDNNGFEGNGDSILPKISADNRYVTFSSTASNLVSDDTNNESDIFIRDLITGETTRVSIDSNGVEGNGKSFDSAISGDGRYITFISKATNLVSNDTNGFDDIFLHDRATGETTRVSVNNTGIESNRNSEKASISTDGRYITIQTSATNLVSGTNGVTSILIIERETGEIRLASLNYS
jgi:YD repeat-containing protein